VNALEIRQRSLEATAGLKVRVAPHLPLIEGEEVLRSQDDIVDRALCLHVACSVAFGYERRRALRWIENEGLPEKLTAQESRLLSHRWASGKQFHMQVESIFVLAWAVGIADGLDFRRPCPETTVYSMPDLLKDEPSGNWRRKAALRGAEEILLARDLAYCLHWAVTEAVFHGRTLRNVDMAGVPERRRALEWLFVDEDWDDVPLDT